MVVGRILARLPGVGPHVQSWRDRRWRTAQLGAFEQAMRFGRLVPDAELEGVLADYAAIMTDTQLGMGGLLNLQDVARAVVRDGLAGAVVECGTWRGGALGFWARAFRRFGGDAARNPIYGFDSFEGMPRMTAQDGAATGAWLYGRDYDERDAEQRSGALKGTNVNVASEAQVRANLSASGLPDGSWHVVKGWFQDTLPAWRERIGPIAVLRLDGDLYESTKVCLDVLYEQVVAGGYVIVDDYYAFEGCRKAIDEFVARQAARPILHAIDHHRVYFNK